MCDVDRVGRRIRRIKIRMRMGLWSHAATISFYLLASHSLSLTLSLEVFWEKKLSGPFY